MKLIAVDTETLKQHFGKKILELEEEKRKVQVELDLFNFKYLSSATQEISTFHGDGFWTCNDRKRGTVYFMR